MNYSFIIDEMTWSFSRLTCFEDCKYRWLLKYIKHYSGTSQFFAQYGSFMHEIHRMFYDGDLHKNELIEHYILNYSSQVTTRAPTPSIYHNYFQSGLEYWKSFNGDKTDVKEVEKEVNFTLNDKPFVGYIDTVKDNDELAITDHKSRNLKPRSGKKKPLKSDLELDEYLRQLYLYSIPLYKEYGKYPDKLQFNCFRTKIFINEPFHVQKLEETKKWASDLINRITYNEDWKPTIEPFACRYICDMHDECEYFQLSK